MNGTFIQEYNGKTIIKSDSKYYITDGTEASLAGAKGYDSIAELVKGENAPQDATDDKKKSKKSK